MSAATCSCASCGRRFVVVKSTDAPEALCVCGAALAAAQLHDGVYELKRSRRSTPRRAPRKPKTEKQTPSAPTTPVEPDLGYGGSHGYGPAHGGPTGPGDAPAPETSEKTETQPANEPG